jgi:hypothetical protein
MKRLRLIGLAAVLAAAALQASCGCELVIEPERCGNGICDWDEWCDTCPEDCGLCTLCGDGFCQYPESCWSCPHDCGDCTGCGDGICESDETCSTCPSDCGWCSGCGDGICDEATESCVSCPADCGSCSECGDGLCDEREFCASCPEDCGVCRGDASLAFTWTILGAAAGPTVCESVGGAAVELRLDLDGDDAPDFAYEFNCGAGAAETPMDFSAGDSIRYAVALLDDRGGAVDESGPWSTALLEEGTNDLGHHDFRCETEHDAAISFFWKIHYMTATDRVCGAVGAWGARILIEETGDDEPEQVIDFPCGAGSGSTGFVFDGGVEMKLAFALVDGEGNSFAHTWMWVYRTLLPGNNNLGEVNFVVGDYGPLRVDVLWESSETPGTYGACGETGPAVTAVGYVLCRGGLEGETCPASGLYDLVNIDVSPLSCGPGLSWDLLDFGLYDLIIDGRDEAGGLEWHGLCLALSVDEPEPGGNSFECRIALAP